MELKELEFYGTPNGDVVIAEAGQPVKIYDQSLSDFTNIMIDTIRDFYPEAFKALCETYTKSKLNPSYFSYLIVHRFIRCNFIKYDNINDIDQNGVLRFEFVSCPLRGECKYCGIICSPKFDSKLSDREIQVMKMYYQSMSTEEIADQLYISICTVKKHKRNSLERLKMHSLTEFISYASRNKMFETEI